MGRTSIAKQKKIERFRNQGFTQQEVVKKLRLDIRTVRKYDPLREQKPVMPTTEQVRQVEEDCNGLVAEGLLHKESDGRVRISYLGKRVGARWDELREKAILDFMAEADRPVKEEEIERYLGEVDGELFDQALDEVKRRYG